MASECCIRKFSMHQLISLCEEGDEIKMVLGEIGCKIDRTAEVISYITVWYW